MMLKTSESRKHSCWICASFGRRLRYPTAGESAGIDNVGDSPDRWPPIQCSDSAWFSAKCASSGAAVARTETPSSAPIIRCCDRGRHGRARTDLPWHRRNARQVCPPSSDRRRRFLFVVELHPATYNRRRVVGMKMMWSKTKSSPRRDGEQVQEFPRPWETIIVPRCAQQDVVGIPGRRPSCARRRLRADQAASPNAWDRR